MLELTFRFVMYVFFGLTLEVIFSVLGIERTLGIKLKKQTPHKYLEGFVSLYMIPLHGLGLLFAFEYVHAQIENLHIIWRYLIWCFSITGCEIVWGYLLTKIVGFFPWDYYRQSRFRLPNAGYSAWTLIPQWGIAGLLLELYSSILIKVSPIAAEIIRNWY